METPKRMRFAATQALISEYFAVRCRRESPSHLICNRCGGEILRVRAYMSLHDDRLGDRCIGPARAWRMDIPYCVGCEEPPSRYGCIHMSEADLSLPSVLDASRPFGREHPEYRRSSSR